MSVDASGEKRDRRFLLMNLREKSRTEMIITKLGQPRANFLSPAGSYWSALYASAALEV